MRNTTRTTHPLPYSKPIDSSRTGEGTAVRTGLCGVALINEDDHPAGLLTFVPQHGLEHANAGVERGLRKGSACHGFGVQIPDRHTLVAVNQSRGRLVERVRTLAGHLAVSLGQPLGDAARHGLVSRLVTGRHGAAASPAFPGLPGTTGRAR
jgi:hypothetical protein